MTTTYADAVDDLLHVWARTHSDWAYVFDRGQVWITTGHAVHRAEPRPAIHRTPSHSTVDTLGRL